MTERAVARRPCLRAFWAERALPSGVRGPVDLAALARLAAARFAETSCFMTPIYHDDRVESEIRFRKWMISRKIQLETACDRFVPEVAFLATQYDLSSLQASRRSR